MLSHRVTTVVAPAGYGKTAWVSSLLDEPDWPATVWLSLDHHDAEPPNLLHHIIRSVKRRCSSFGQDSLRTLMSLENMGREWSIAALALLEELPREQQLVLVFDDLHLIYKNELSCTIMEFLLNRLPGNVHAALLARHKPPFDLYRQELNDELLEIHSKDLLFTNEEARDLFSLMDINVSSPDAEDLNNRAEGWAVGLRLLGNYIKRSGGGIDDALHHLQTADSSFYRYLIHEILETMPDNERDFILDASLLPYLEAGLCDAALRLDNSASLIKALQAYGLFHALENEKGAWRIHHLLASWMQDRTMELRSGQYIAGLRDRTALYLEKSGDINRAVEQAVINSNWDMAAGLIRKYGYDYFIRAGKGDILFQWIERFPEDLVAADCWLLYFKGASITHTDDQQAFQVWSKAADIAVQTGDVKCEACCMLALQLSSIYCGDLKKSEEAALRFKRQPALMSNPLSRPEALITAMMIAIQADNPREGLDLSRQVLRLKLIPEQHMNALSLYAFFFFRLGNQTRARQLVEKALALPIAQENERLFLMSSIIGGLILDASDDEPALMETCQLHLNLGQKYNMPIVSARALYFRGRMHYRNGRFREAEQDLDSSFHYYTSAGVTSVACMVALVAMPARIRNGENPGELLQESLELLDKFEEAPYGQGIDYWVCSLAGIVALEAGELETAGQLFEKAANRWREIGAKQNLAGTNLLTTHLLLLQGREKAADKLLRSALGTAETWQWKNFWEWHDLTIYTVCRRALQKNIHPHWAAHLLGRWFPARSRQELGCLLISEDEQVRKAATVFFQEEFNKTGKAVIHAFYLGGFRVFVNGQLVEEPEWRTQKAENLFKYLAVERKQLSKEHIVQHLWPGTETQSGDIKLRTTLNHVRKALASDCVLTWRGKIYLHPEIEIYNDYELFMREAAQALSYGKEHHPQAVSALEHAIKIYHGEFLPDDTYDDWTGSYRLRLNSLYLEVLLELARALERRNNLAAALQACYQYLALEPLDEPAVRLTMGILDRMGKKAKAIALFKTLTSSLEHEFNAVPETETVRLYERIRNPVHQ